MTKTIATHIRNISETFVGIFMGISLGYIIYYHHGHEKWKKYVTIANDTVCIPLVRQQIGHMEVRKKMYDLLLFLFQSSEPERPFEDPKYIL